MNILRTVAAATAVTLLASGHLAASGRVGFYGIVERVVFEPDAASADRVQVWGVFAYADGRRASDSGVPGTSAVERGYLYFALPDREVDLVRREWADLAAVAGTGQAVAFGRWNYFGVFDGLPHIPAGTGTVRVRPASEPPASPAPYFTNAGIVKLSDRGGHAAVVAQLREHPGTKSRE